MEESLKFNSQICTTIEQSKRLLELGLKPETADMSYYILDDEPVLIIGITQVYRETIKGGKIIGKQNAEKIPAWSLHRLLDILPNEIIYEDCSLILCVSHNIVYYADNDAINGIEIIDIEIARYNGKIECVYFLKNQTSIFQHKLL